VLKDVFRIDLRLVAYVLCCQTHFFLFVVLPNNRKPLKMNETKELLKDFYKNNQTLTDEACDAAAQELASTGVDLTNGDGVEAFVRDTFEPLSEATKLSDATVQTAIAYLRVVRRQAPSAFRRFGIATLCVDSEFDDLCTLAGLRSLIPLKMNETKELLKDVYENNQTLTDEVVMAKIGELKNLNQFGDDADSEERAWRVRASENIPEPAGGNSGADPVDFLVETLKQFTLHRTTTKSTGGSLRPRKNHKCYAKRRCSACLEVYTAKATIR